MSEKTDCLTSRVTITQGMPVHLRIRFVVSGAPSQHLMRSMKWGITSLVAKISAARVRSASKILSRNSSIATWQHQRRLKAYVVANEVSDVEHEGLTAVLMNEPKLRDRRGGSDRDGRGSLDRARCVVNGLVGNIRRIRIGAIVAAMRLPDSNRARRVRRPLSCGAPPCHATCC